MSQGTSSATRIIFYRGCKNPLAFQQHTEILKHSIGSCRRCPWTHQQVAQHTMAECQLVWGICLDIPSDIQLSGASAWMAWVTPSCLGHLPGWPGWHPAVWGICLDGLSDIQLFGASIWMSWVTTNYLGTCLDVLGDIQLSGVSVWMPWVIYSYLEHLSECPEWYPTIWCIFSGCPEWYPAIWSISLNVLSDIHLSGVFVWMSWVKSSYLGHLSGCPEWHPIAWDIYLDILSDIQLLQNVFVPFRHRHGILFSDELHPDLGRWEKAAHINAHCVHCLTY